MNARLVGQGARRTEGAAQVSFETARRYRRERWASALFAVLLSSLLILSGAPDVLENWLGDARARLLNRAPTGQTAIVEIDAKSIAAMKKWPWSRRIHAELVNRLHNAGASIIAFDVDFSAVSDPAGDQSFAQALRDVQPVVLPIFQQRASDDPREQSMIRNRPAPQFGAAWVGGVNVLPGRDGVVREFPAATMIDGQIQPSMAVLLSENSRIGDRAFMPDWSIDATLIPHFSFIDVLGGKVSRASLAGKRILIGATATELGDRYTVPRFGTVPGVVVQALATESLLQHRAISRSGILPMLIGLCLITILLGSPYRNFNRTFPLTAAGVFALLLTAPIAIQWRWPLSVDTSVLLITAALGVALRAIVETRRRIWLNNLRDHETGLPNDRSLSAAIRDGGSLGTLTAASIDRFDRVRIAMGPQACSSIIGEVAHRVEDATGVRVYRIAADTLAWLTNGDDAEGIAKEVEARFVDPVITLSGPVDVSLTLGIATAGAGKGSCVEQALAAISTARAAGNRSQRFQGLGVNQRRDLSMIGELRRGIAEGQVFVAYQPKLDLRSGGIMNAEALIRWAHPLEGLIPPDRFVALAEETGFICELTNFVLGRVLADWAEVSRRGVNPGLSVNLSAHDISEPGFADRLIDLISQSGLNSRQLTLEITESAIIRSPATAFNVLHAIREHGIRLSIDDYGTGQSTLSYLKSLPVDELKIDKSFVTSICTDVNDQIMVRSTIEMAHDLGLSVVAEGVETEGTLRLLNELNCDFAQGFLIGKATSLGGLWYANSDASKQRKVA